MNLFKNKNMKNEFVKFGSYTYRLNLDKLKEICFKTSEYGGSKEIEIAQTYEIDDDDELSLVSKVEHETKSIGNSQNDMVTYDLFKLLLVSLLEIDLTVNNFEPTFGVALTINTLLSCGILEKIN